MTVEVVLGLPYLSGGALTRTARRLRAPVLLSANSFSKWRDVGPAPKGYEVSLMERRQRMARGETAPFATKRPQRMRDWIGWNVSQMVHAEGLSSVDLDSAGFHAMAAWGGFPWTPRSYVQELCTAFPFRRVSSMDLCVEAEVAQDRDAVRERISKTVALNRECRSLAVDAGIADRLMQVIQGATADDYLRCFDAMSGMIGDHAVIGVGSMCRRRAGGDDGIVAIVDQLDRRLPQGVRLHLFGLKSDGAEAVAMLSPRVASIDSQAFGVRARRIANDERARDPSFSKTNAFVAGVMETWWTGQVARMERGRRAVLQASLPMPPAPETPPATVFDALMVRARAEMNQLIEDGELDHDELCSETTLLQWVQDWYDDLPDDVCPNDPYTGLEQLPAFSEGFGTPLDPALVHPAMRRAGETPWHERTRVAA
jgi:hypothetical protein